MKTFEELMQRALKIEKPTEICFPTTDKIRETINPSDYRFYEKCFSFGGDVIAFVYGKDLYVVPYHENAESILLKEGLKKKYFYVPLTRGAYPVEEKERWKELKNNVRNRVDIHEKCIEYAKEKGYGTIEEDSLEEYCFQIPEEGVEVERVDGSRIIHFPAIRYIKNDTILCKIGLYSIRNGICSFVYNDGKTYVTCHEFVVEELKKAGYKEGFLWVPFSDRYEKIINLDYSIAWQRILRL